jgi:S1-C subfamily serine protease
VAAPADPPRVTGSSVSLGTIPDYDESVKGVRLNGVREKSAAEKAGMKAGDVIVGFGGKPVGTIYDFMESMSTYKPGDEVEVTVQRDGKELKLKAKLDAAARRDPSSSPH